jgi:hypothetical protein
MSDATDCADRSCASTFPVRALSIIACAVWLPAVAVAQSTLEASCPSAIQQMQAAMTARKARQPDIAHVTRPALQRELVLMADNDQAARRDWEPSSPTPESVAAIDAHNLRRLEEILHQDGFPTAAMVGYNGVAAAWLLLQHTPFDSKLRDRWLPVLTARVKSGELSEEELSLTIDRALIASGRPQRYGTQVSYKDGVFALLPTEDPGHLDRRRRSLGLIPEADYLCVDQWANSVHSPDSQASSE